MFDFQLLIRYVSDRSRTRVDDELMEILEAYGIERIAKDFAKHRATIIKSDHKLDNDTHKEMGFNTKTVKTQIHNRKVQPVNHFASYTHSTATHRIRSFTLTL